MPPSQTQSAAADETKRVSAASPYPLAGAERGQRLIHSGTTFRQLIEYERARADRSPLGFAFLTFMSRDEGRDQAQLQAAVSYLSRRLRSIDEIGWMQVNCLGILLPYTTASGAWKVADDTLANLDTSIEPPHCDVQTYACDDGDAEPLLSDEIGSGGDAPSGVPLDPIFCQKLPRSKRVIDILGATAALLLLAPLLLLVAALLTLTSPGPILFQQKRSGLGGRPFSMYKFRTMVIHAEAYRDALLAFNEQDGPAFKLKNDPRVFPLGRLLRSSSIDELLQLWNVLRGEMSLVGPRPLPCAESAACANWQRRRLDVTPGLTCIWQVHGRSQVSFDEWMRMDLQYLRSRTLLQDLKLIVLTLPAVVLRRGAH